jgi:hypothetical protein
MRNMLAPDFSEKHVSDFARDDLLNAIRPNLVVENFVAQIHQFY